MEYSQGGDIRNVVLEGIRHGNTSDADTSPPAIAWDGPAFLGSRLTLTGCVVQGQRPDHPGDRAWSGYIQVTEFATPSTVVDIGTRALFNPGAPPFIESHSTTPVVPATPPTWLLSLFVLSRRA